MREINHPEAAAPPSQRAGALRLVTARLVLRIQQRFGYQLEGKRRQAYRCMADGTLKNECIMGLLKAEWKMD